MAYLLEKHNIEAVVVGASAGGVHALLNLFSGLPAHFRLPIVTVLHLSSGRDSQLPEIFRHRLSMNVREAADKEKIKPSTLYFAGPGYHLSVEADRSFSLSCEEPLNYSRPSIDVLMVSAADAYGTSLAGILLTGANLDGSDGMAHIKERGGITVVQDPAEAEVPTMPESAIRRSPPSLILTLADIRNLLIELNDTSC